MGQTRPSHPVTAPHPESSYRPSSWQRRPPKPGLGSTEIDRETQERLTLDVTSIVLDLGVNVDQADQTGTTPLHDAVRVGFPSVVEFLVSRGANVNVTMIGETHRSLSRKVCSPFLALTDYGPRGQK
ncbi:MAG: hypothetical protein Ct9H300mP25_09870 [Acidobacteriota bacterium]|nr:MAG: hypothetical protein Ct9H300mP25_09870 [Acidobacteriota bacterium]